MIDSSYEKDIILSQKDEITSIEISGSSNVQTKKSYTMHSTLNLRNPKRKNYYFEDGMINAYFRSISKMPQLT